MDESSNTPLHLAATNRSAENINLLLSHPKIDLTLRNHRDLTPLCKAMIHQHWDVATSLLIADMPYDIYDEPVPPRKHGHSWTAFMDASSPVPEDVKTNVLEKLKEYPPVHLKKIMDRLCTELDLNDSPSHKLMIAMRDYFCGRYEFSTRPCVNATDSMAVVDVLDHKIGSQLLEECSTNGKLDVVKVKALNDKLGWFKDSKKLEMAISVVENGLFDVIIPAKLLIASCLALLIMPSESPERMSACVPTIAAHQKLNLNEFPYVLALDLDEVPTVDHIFNHCRASKEDMLDHLKVVASALDYMHNKGLVHCDLRLCNVYLDDKILIGNLEASTKIGDYFPHGQFTTGVPPPELFYKLQNDEERQLYEDCWGQNPGWSTRFKPAHDIVVKAWAKSMPLHTNL
ncbi:unnamed protein product [Aphanomyces euteiches]